MLIEDNPEDVQLTTEAFKSAEVNAQLITATDGEQALMILRQEGDYTDQTPPDLILLDFSLPKVSGRELLKEIKNDPHLKMIPVIILTGSEADQDIHSAYDMYANSYIKKPHNWRQFTDIALAIKNFWLSVVILPHRA